MSAGLILHFGTSNKPAFLVINAEHGQQIDYSNRAYQPKGLFRSGRRVMLDAELAKLYGVTTSSLHQAVQRNRERFPEDFMFRLGKKDTEFLRSQFVISNPTGTGADVLLAMRSPSKASRCCRACCAANAAAQVNVAIMRRFVCLREMLSSHEELRREIDAMEKRYDARFQAVFETIQRMLETPIPAKKTIGFHAQIGSLAKSGESRRLKRNR
jgi:hypothetical protein